jgi:hypothetical protein
MGVVMSKLMWIAGILLIAIGLALGLMVFVSPASVVCWGLTPEVAAILIVGGFLSLGLGGVINAIEQRPDVASEPAYARRMETPVTTIPEFGRRMSEQAAPAAAAVAGPAAAVAASATSDLPEVSEPVKETIQALEQARQRIEQAFDPKPDETLVTEIKTVVVAEPEPVIEVLAEEDTAAEPNSVETAAEVEAEPEAEEIEEEPEAEEGQLYVIEERLIRARPARILSDGTVEAETDEGWMRFENLEHLDEYLDSMTPARG